MKISELPDISPMLPIYVNRDKFIEKWGIKYSYEPKYDGYCCILYWTREDGKTLFSSRSEKILRDIYPKFRRNVTNVFEASKYDSIILQGEIIAWDKEHPGGNLDALQNRSRRHCALRVMAFDLLYLDGKDLRETPYQIRRKKLRFLLKEKSPYIKLVPAATSISELPTIANVEGHVAKNSVSLYYAGKHSSWIKIKPREGTDFIVTGYTDGLGQHADTFGALEVAEFRNEKLVHCGKVGTGFTFEQREKIKWWIDTNCKGAKNDRDAGWEYFQIEVYYARRTADMILWHPSYSGKCKFSGE